MSDGIYRRTLRRVSYRVEKVHKEIVTAKEKDVGISAFTAYYIENDVDHKA